MKRARRSLENSLLASIELIESYAKVGFQKTSKIQFFIYISPFLNILGVLNPQISSMIEIEVEMDSDVLAAEAASNAVTNNILVY